MSLFHVLPSRLIRGVLVVLICMTALVGPLLSGHGEDVRAGELYPAGKKVVGDDLFVCGSEAVAEKIQKIGLAPENAGAIIENNDCFFLNRFDHIPLRHGKISNDLLVLETRSEKLGLFYAIVPLKP